MKNPFKKKLVVDGVAEIKAVEPAPTPKLKAACGFEFNGTIYKTVKEANLEYQRSLICEKFKRSFDETEYQQIRNTWRGEVLMFWEELAEIAHKKLDVE